MNIVTEGHDRVDAVRQILQLFFDIRTDIDVLSCLKYENGKYSAKTILKINGQTAEGTAEYKSAGNRREVSDVIKKSVLTACRFLSKMPTPWGISTGIRPAKQMRQMLDEGFSDSEIISYMKNEMWISDRKADLSLEVAKKEKEIIDNRLKNGISLYVGIPFCPTRCAYCSFVSQAFEYNRKFVIPFRDALLKEMKKCGEIADSLGLKVETVYFGGGTPSSLPKSILKSLLDGVCKNFDLSCCREFTVEAGRPDTFSEEMLYMLKDMNVNRISINPQTMHSETLELIGRKHTVEDTLKAFEMVKKVGGFSVNADLIAGLPGENAEMFKQSVDKLAALNPEAITVHTMYMKRAAKIREEFEKYRFSDRAAEMVDYSQNKLRSEGYKPYYLYKQKDTLGNLENVGFSKKGKECLYNIYIMEEVQTLMAMGGGASSKIIKGTSVQRIYNPKDAADYIKRIDEILEKKEHIKELSTS